MTSFEALPAHSRVWIYQSDRAFTADEINEINANVENFVDQWVSHNNKLAAFGKVFYDRFIVLMVDESKAGASGCSIDSSVRFIQSIESRYGVNLFDRLIFSFKQDDKVVSVPHNSFSQLFEEGKINENTLVFDNLVNIKDDFENLWLKPLKESWHQRMVGSYSGNG